MTPPSDVLRIERILSRLEGRDPARAVCAPLAGGITNQNWRVDLDGEVLVVRAGGKNTDLLGIDREREYEASRIAAELGVGAEVVAYLPGEDAMVSRFIAGRSVAPEEAARPDVLERIVSSIRTVHDGPPFPGTFSPFETVRTYCRTAKAHGVSLPERSASATALLDRIERALAPAGALVPCHNDLLAANLIDDGARIRVLDWEYAAMGNRFFDLGNFAANQRLDRDGCDLLLRLYFGEARAGDRARLHLMRLASDLREASWGFVQAGISDLEFDFMGYAEEHLDRFLSGAEDPELDDWLESAPVRPS